MVLQFLVLQLSLKVDPLLRHLTLHCRQAVGRSLVNVEVAIELLLEFLDESRTLLLPLRRLPSYVWILR